MSDPTENVPDELDEQLDDLEEQLDELSEKLRDPNLREPKGAGHTIEDQTEEGSIAAEDKPDGSDRDQ